MDAAEPVMVMSWQLSPPVATEEERDLLRREYRLAQASGDFWLGFDRLNSRIQNASDILQRLRGSIEAAIAPADRPPAPRPAAAPAENAGIAATSPPAGSTEGGAGMQWILAAAAVLGGLTLVLLRQHGAAKRAQRLQPVFVEEQQAAAVMTSPPAPRSSEPPPAPRSSELPPAPVPAREGGDSAPRTSPATEPAAPAPALNPDREEMDHALDLAEVMLSYGRKSGAMQTLKDYLQEHPDVSVRPWLKLLELYRQTGMREDFEREAETVHRHFNVKVPGWDEGVSGVPLRSFFEDDEGVEILGLEQIPHILQKIQATWPDAACQAYLQSLLLDNRGGGRQGFPVSVVAEILLLEDILTVRLAGQT